MHEPHLSEAQVSAITDAILANNKILAIKLYRSATNCNLKEAKEAVEAIQADLAKDHPELAAPKSSGCASLLILGLFAIGALSVFLPAA